ncbi:UDP-glucuronosyltransferase 2A2-like [Anoplopoma fimbria]|uniref:UDP-glucuronosyltransferase 2A2-like n=1 Tax=Anoplopoma fimbria TaxID=229290 RepID=UPI0023EDAFCE|nr:UDP-glucuronosyltransferase 2A2-like [Anoplopoma fimbria]
MQVLLPLLLVLLSPDSQADGGHVLVFPGEYSHWLNMRSLVEELVRRNHSVTVLVSAAETQTGSASWCSRAELKAIPEELIHFIMYESHVSSLLQKFMKIRDVMGRMMDFGMRQCDAMLKNEQLMATLRDAAFDAVLLDPVTMCGELVADVLGLPLIISLRFTFGGVMERHCGHAPPSYVPVPPLAYSDRMTFVERLVNTVTYVWISALTELFWVPKLDKYYSEVKGHPKTRAFVTHGGTNGLYEAVFHAVPMVGIPIFGDQHDNLARLSRRGAAVVLDFNYLTTDELTEALHAIITEPSYKSSVQRLSALHHDRPVSALNNAAFWVEFVMRHGGARHLRLASHDLNLFQYYSVDTGAALLVTMTAAAALCWSVARYFLRRCCRRRGREKAD